MSIWSCPQLQFSVCEISGTPVIFAARAAAVTALRSKSLTMPSPVAILITPALMPLQAMPSSISFT